MKHKFKIVLIFFTFFLLVGCDNVPEDIITQIEDALPSITIVGDELIIVEQYTTFTDPGVDVPGDFDLEVTTVTDLDIRDNI